MSELEFWQQCALAAMRATLDEDGGLRKPENVAPLAAAHANAMLAELRKWKAVEGDR